MAISDKLLELNQIKSDIKTAITNKGQTVSDDMNEYASAIDSISTTPNLQEKTASLKIENQNIVADSGYDGLSKVVVPKGIGFERLFHISGEGVGYTKEYTFDVEVEPPYETDGGSSEMTTTIIVSVEDDDINIPINFPFTIRSGESYGTVDIFPTSVYQGFYVPSNSASSNYFTTDISMSLNTYDYNTKIANVTLSVNTESKQAEYNLYVYRLNYFSNWAE